MSPLWKEPLTLVARRGEDAPDAACLVAARVSAVHRSAARRPPFQLVVALLESPRGHFVLRRAVGADATPQLRAIWEHGAALARDLDRHSALAEHWAQPDAALFTDGAGQTLVLETMLDGPTDEARMVLALERGLVDDAIAVAAGYRTGLELFATQGRNVGRGSILPAWSFDLMPQNVIRGADGRRWAFDLEWAPTIPLTLEFVLTRALLNMAGACEHLAGNFQDDDAPSLKLWNWHLPQALCRAFVPGEDRLETCFPEVARHECDFQARVQWQPPWHQAPDPRGMVVTAAPRHRVPGRDLFGWARLQRRLGRDDAAPGEPRLLDATEPA